MSIEQNNRIVLIMKVFRFLKFRFMLRNHETCNALSEKFSNLLDAGIVECDKESDYYYMKLVFADGSEAEVWNANRYYAWVCRGSISGFGKYDGIMPSKKIMRRLYYAIKDFENVSPDEKRHDLTNQMIRAFNEGDTEKEQQLFDELFEQGHYN